MSHSNCSDDCPVCNPKIPPQAESEHEEGCARNIYHPHKASREYLRKNQPCTCKTPHSEGGKCEPYCHLLPLLHTGKCSKICDCTNCPLPAQGNWEEIQKEWEKSEYYRIIKWQFPATYSMVATWWLEQLSRTAQEAEEKGYADGYADKMVDNEDAAKSEYERGREQGRQEADWWGEELLEARRLAKLSTIALVREGVEKEGVSTMYHDKSEMFRNGYSSALDDLLALISRLEEKI